MEKKKMVLYGSKRKKPIYQEEKKPVEKQITPVDQQKTPVDQQKTPVERQKTPVERQKTLVKKEKKPAKKPVIFSSIAVVCRECWQNRRQMVKIAAYNLKIQHNATHLRLLWTFVEPALLTLTHWIVFHIGMRVNSPIDGISYLIWMMTGLVPWLFMSKILLVGPNCMLSSKNIIKNMKYPLATIPVQTVGTELIAHLCFMAILITVQLIGGVHYGIQSLWLLYFMSCALLFLIGFSFLMSTLTVFVPDIYKVMQQVVRLMFFLTPITWSSTNSVLAEITRWNPFVYIIEGYRGALLHQGQFIIPVTQHVYFWALTLIIMLLGLSLHVKLRPHFVDLM